jgi:hypothetical protein
LELYVPLSHKKQVEDSSIAPDELPYVPIGQGRQAKFPKVLAYDPAWQRAQTVAPILTLLYEPKVQG